MNNVLNNNATKQARARNEVSKERATLARQGTGTKGTRGNTVSTVVSIVLKRGFRGKRRLRTGNGRSRRSTNKKLSRSRGVSGTPNSSRGSPLNEERKLRGIESRLKTVLVPKPTLL